MQSRSIAPSRGQTIRPLLNIVPTLLKSSIIDTTEAIRLTEVRLLAPFLKQYKLLWLQHSAFVCKPTFPWDVNRSWLRFSAGIPITVCFLFPECLTWWGKRGPVSKSVCRDVDQTSAGPSVFAWYCPQNPHLTYTWRTETLPCQTSKH